MKRGKKICFIGGYLILAAALLMGGCGAKEQTGTGESVKEENVASVEATAVPTATPAPTPEPTPEPAKEAWTYTPPEIQKPMELSGNPKDEYILTQPEYIETDEFIMFMDTGTKIYGNTPELIATIFDLVEKETGLNRNNVPDFAFMPAIGPQSIFYGCSDFLKVDPEQKKFHIYVTSNEKGSPCGGYGCIWLNYADMEIAAGGGDIIVHEYTHSLHAANGPWLSRFLTEGYATYITAQITEKDEKIPFDFDVYYNYSNYNVKITKENAEQVARDIDQSSFDNYLYGFRFVHFLMETYGEDIFRNILSEASAMVDKNWNELYMEETIECIKRSTSETVFEEFADWLKENKKRFESY